MSRADQYQMTQQPNISNENKYSYPTHQEDSSIHRDPGYIFSCCAQCFAGICMAITCGLCCEACDYCDC